MATDRRGETGTACGTPASVSRICSPGSAALRSLGCPSLAPRMMSLCLVSRAGGLPWPHLLTRRHVAKVVLGHQLWCRPPYDASASSNALASCRSAVSKPSVNQP
jgi:hypothetical protein